MRFYRVFYYPYINAIHESCVSRCGLERHQEKIVLVVQTLARRLAVLAIDPGVGISIRAYVPNGSCGCSFNEWRESVATNWNSVEPEAGRETLPFFFPFSYGSNSPRLMLPEMELKNRSHGRFCQGR